MHARQDLDAKRLAELLFTWDYGRSVAQFLPNWMGKDFKRDGMEVCCRVYLIVVKHDLVELDVGPVVRDPGVLWRHRLARATPRCEEFDHHDPVLLCGAIYQRLIVLLVCDQRDVPQAAHDDRLP